MTEGFKDQGLKPYMTLQETTHVDLEIFGNCCTCFMLSQTNQAQYCLFALRTVCPFPALGDAKGLAADFLHAAAWQAPAHRVIQPLFSDVPVPNFPPSYLLCGPNIISLDTCASSLHSGGCHR